MLLPLLKDDKQEESEGYRAELGDFGKTLVDVTGTDWNKSTVDIAIAGMGWVAIGLKVNFVPFYSI